MNSVIRIALTTTPEQLLRLQALQQAFAQVCNALAPTVQKTRCWNRVALHHMVYKAMREKFPAMGSQMVCNAIYSVSRTSRLVYQHPKSPFNVARLGDKPLPLLMFTSGSPVYFDRHTLSLKEGKLSLYTLDGRMRFDLALKPLDEAKFHKLKVLEIVLTRRGDGVFELTFSFIEALPSGQVAAELDQPDAVTAPVAQQGLAQTPMQDMVLSGEVVGAEMEIPAYVMVEEAV
jgi:hypothetical protein